MPRVSMEPTNQTFQELMGNGVMYQVPRFQRDYAWEQTQWEDLWGDIQQLSETEYHYMGYLVLQQVDAQSYVVVDGQQRLISLSLIILAALQQLQSLIQEGQEVEANQVRFHELSWRFISTQDPISLRLQHKLSLNRHNDPCFKALSTLSKQQVTEVSACEESLLNKGLAFFRKQFFGNTGAEIATFVEHFTCRVVFTRLVTSDEGNAYKIFETLNTQGVPLSTPDSVKNYLFSVLLKAPNASTSELDALEQQWQQMTNLLGKQDCTDFLRYHYNFQFSYVSRKNFFNALRKQLNTSEAIYPYLNNLQDYASLYYALTHPNDAWWQQQDKIYIEAQAYLTTLNVFNIKAAFTVLMAAFFNFTAPEFVKLCRFVTVLSVRYGVLCCHLPLSEQESHYSQLAIAIYTGVLNRAGAVKNNALFKSLYPDDQTVIVAFKTQSLPNVQTTEQLRHLLTEIECSLGTSIDPDTVFLETIGTDELCTSAFNGHCHDLKDRIGNALVLPQYLQKSLLHKSFAEKRALYSESGFQLARLVASYPVWDAAHLGQFHNRLAEYAAKTWHLHQD